MEKMIFVNDNHKTNKKAKFARMNLNKLPTLKDLELGARLAEIALDHTIARAAGKNTGILSEKFAARIKQFRINKK